MDGDDELESTMMPSVETWVISVRSAAEHILDVTLTVPKALFETAVLAGIAAVAAGAGHLLFEGFENRPVEDLPAPHAAH